MPPDPLRDYRDKRDFDRSPEPRGDATGRSSGRVFVVQKHAARQLHFDLRLEMDGVLKSWALPRGPSLDPTQKPLAVHVEDHPLEYGDFEGIIPAGEYGGGTVMLWDRGEWEPIGDAAEGYAKGDLKFELHGEKLRGAWVLARMKGAGNEDGKNWLLIKKRDADARPVASFNVQAELPYSVASGRTMDQIAADPGLVWADGHARAIDGSVPHADDRELALPDPSTLPGAQAAVLPARVKPQLCGTAAIPPEGPAWIHEIKLDGYRLQCRIENGRVQLLTRNGHDWTDVFGAVARAAGRLGANDTILDGEVVVLGTDGRPDFGALQGALRGGRPRAFTYFAFDVPFALGFDLRQVPLLERKQYLTQLFESAPTIAPTIRASEHIPGAGAVVFEQAAAMGLEGIISKRVDARYEERRSDTWLKIKARLCQEFVIGGYTKPATGRTGFGALLVGYYDDDDTLVYAGRVGSGFDEAALRALTDDLEQRRCDTTPFRNADADPGARSARWVRPELVAEVEFTTWTKDHLLRQPVYRGLRPDVDPTEVVREPTPGATTPASTPSVAAMPPRRKPVTATTETIVAGVRISHPERPVFPEARVTKGEVAAYYEQIAEWVLPFLVKRPLSLVRCPLGLAGESFYQRHVGDGFPASIRGIPHGSEIEGEPYVVIDDLEGLVSLVQMGVLEIHTWGSRVDNLERPDHLVIDLDPGEGILWEHVAASAEFVRTYLEDLGLVSFVKTSGGAGAHVIVPIVRRSSWDDVKSFTHDIAKDLARIAPKNFVATMSKEFRVGRIYVDYLRNVRGATAVGAYSTRARPGARVSTPLRWDELSPSRGPEHYTVRTVPRRLARMDRDPWEGFGDVRQSITAGMRKAVRR
ncbi:MAG: DNA ligase D [Phycisphaerales bacterium]|nr:DNA ligase D [Phycisphaerales bacterium]